MIDDFDPFRPASDTAHEHLEPFALAIKIQFGNRKAYSRVVRQGLQCAECHRAFETLSAWLMDLDHRLPVVGPEIITRHQLYNDLFSYRHTPAERLRLVQGDELWRTWGFCRLLIDRAGELVGGANALALEHAKLAWAIARQLDEEFYDRAYVQDLRAEAAARLGCCHALGGGESLTGSYLTKAYELLGQGTGRRPPRERVTRLETAYFEQSGEFERARKIAANADPAELELVGNVALQTFLLLSVSTLLVEKDQGATGLSGLDPDF